MNLKTGKVVADRETLLKLEKQQVIIAEWQAPFVTRFYYNIIPEISVTQCSSCYRVRFYISMQFENSKNTESMNYFWKKVHPFF